ncbi:MAG TPA: NHL domain-containing thioredoxin family protein [Planctomycetota bacterium]|nr:NHL domain-containing thioredoxin family protein [Planctomycetota bacterium]
MFPDLRKLEAKFPRELVVIGVHSGKFPAEKDTENIRKAVMRHDIRHPVVNDADFKIFSAYGARGWPHLVLVDPEGRIVGKTGGEGNYEVLETNIKRLVEQFDKTGKVDRKELKFRMDEEKTAGLRFPAKIFATADHLYISDTGHHRILVTHFDGTVVKVIGSGTAGLQDGDFKTAQFNQPHGLFAEAGILFVADTENHVIRRIDLKEKRVETIAGTGQQVYGSDSGAARKVPLNSPWDVLVKDGLLYVAMAGNHAIWRMDLAKGTIGPFAGDGRETLEDGPNPSASFNQPSGLAILGDKLYVADSEVSGVREVELNPDGNTRTIVGTGLFKFGDEDGVGDRAKLQHVLHVAAWDGKLLVADSYNHKIKVVDPKTREAKTFLGDGQKGAIDGEKPRFNEPAGMAVAGGMLFIADTNNHSIRVVDLSDKRVRTLAITGLGR